MREGAAGYTQRQVAVWTGGTSNCTCTTYVGSERANKAVERPMAVGAGGASASLPRDSAHEMEGCVVWFAAPSALVHVA